MLSIQDALIVSDIVVYMDGILIAIIVCVLRSCLLVKWFVSQK